MKYHNHGSITLIVVVCMSFLMLYCIQLQRATAYMYATLVERTRHERLVYAVRALTHYCADVTRVHFNEVLHHLEQKKIITVKLSPLPDPWRTLFSSSSHALLTWTLSSAHALKINVALECHDKERSTVACTIERKETGDKDNPYTYHMSEWRER